MNPDRNWLKRRVANLWNNEFVREVTGRSNDRLMTISSRSMIIGGAGLALLLAGRAADNDSAIIVGLITATASLGVTTVSLGLAVRKDNKDASNQIRLRD